LGGVCGHFAGARVTKEKVVRIGPGKLVAGIVTLGERNTTPKKGYDAASGRRTMMREEKRESERNVWMNAMIKKNAFFFRLRVYDSRRTKKKED